MSYFSSDDLYHFNQGTATHLYEKLGAHLGESQGTQGTHFSVWAPSAKSVRVVGDFNAWSDAGATLTKVNESGIWHAFVPQVTSGMLYKYRIEDANGSVVLKSDPLGFAHEIPPNTASRVSSLQYNWNDATWTEKQKQAPHASAISTYEFHLGSWKRNDAGEHLSYREIAPLLIAHVSALEFTHVEFMPVTEHPFYGSWGYQVTGYFAATSRYGSPQDLMFLIDSLHQAGIGVILDWVPAHFPVDAHGLGDFDGTHLYEHADPKAGFHPDWKTYIFNYGRHEVRSFLISSAIFWFDKFHIDGLRVDGVASMLYLDYSRNEGEWIPNKHGGNYNLEAIAFLQELNTAIYREFPHAQTIAEESTAFPKVTRPVDQGGLGFGFKWDMGWMHDTLEYFQRDPIHRAHHQDDITRRNLWAFTENFALPLSHDEVVHGKGSLLDRMPGDTWQQFANLRLLFGHMYGCPGKKLLFMGCEFGQSGEWKHEEQLPWEMAANSEHMQIQRCVTELNKLYKSNSALYELDCEAGGFQWVHTQDARNSILVYARKNRVGDTVYVVLNATPEPHKGYRLGAPEAGTWELLLDTDSTEFGGSGYSQKLRVQTECTTSHGHENSVVLDIPPLCASFWQLASD